MTKVWRECNVIWNLWWRNFWSLWRGERLGCVCCWEGLLFWSTMAISVCPSLFGPNGNHVSSV